MAATMVDTMGAQSTPPYGPYHMTTEHDEHEHDFGPDFAHFDLGNNNAFTDVNAEYASLQKSLRLDVQEVTVITPAASSSRTTSSLADGRSETQSALWVPQEAGLRCATTADENGHMISRDISLDEYIHHDAYDHTPTLTPTCDESLQAVNDDGVIGTQTHTFTPMRDVPEPVKNVPAACGAPSLAAMNHEGVAPALARRSGLIRKISKRDRQDTSGTTNGLTRQRSKRHKSIEGGFACESCDETFNRACDQAKHFKRAHAGDDAKPHSCSECSIAGKVKRFLYPKDLRRHHKQVHSKIDTANRTPDVVVVSPNASEPPTPTSPSSSALWAVTKAVQRFKHLRISPPSPVADPTEEKYIMVSTDQRNFQEVSVTGITGADALVARILHTLGLRDQELHAQSYNRNGRAIQLGQRLNREHLLHLVSQAADPQGTLKLLIHTSRQ